MKKFRKIKLGELANASLMSEAEMKMVTGGYGDGGYESGGYGAGGSNPKQDACKNKQIGDSCNFKWKGSTWYGTCQWFAGASAMHCSDLN